MQGAGLDAAVDEALAKGLGLGHVIEREDVFGGAGHLEKIGHRAQGQHQFVVADATRRQQLGAIIGQQRRQRDAALGALDCHQLAAGKFKAMFGRLRGVIYLAGLRIALARGDSVQQGLPEVGRPAVDQDHPRSSGLACAVSEPGSQFQAACAASNNDDGLHKCSSNDC